MHVEATSFEEHYMSNEEFLVEECKKRFAVVNHPLLGGAKLMKDSLKVPGVGGRTGREIDSIFER